MAGSELEWVDSWGFGLKAFLWESKLTPWSSPGEWVRTERRQALERAGRGQAGVQSACILWPLVDYLGMVFLVVTAGGRQTQFHIITKYFLNRIATLIWQKFLFLIVIFFKIYNSDNNALDHFFLINFHRTSKKKKAVVWKTRWTVGNPNLFYIFRWDFGDCRRQISHTCVPYAVLLSVSDLSPFVCKAGRFMCLLQSF